MNSTKDLNHRQGNSRSEPVEETKKRLYRVQVLLELLHTKEVPSADGVDAYQINEDVLGEIDKGGGLVDGVVVQLEAKITEKCKIKS